MTAQGIAELARAAGRAGRSWGAWTCEDVVQDYVAAHLGPGAEVDAEIETWEAAHREGLRARRAAPVGEGGEGWLARWTTAPEDYDAFGTTTVEPCGAWHDRTLRRVLIEPRNLIYQDSRYRSGLYGVWERDPRIEEREAEERSAGRRREDAERAARRAAGLEWLRLASEDEIGAIRQADIVEDRGLTYADLRDEGKRRAEVAAEAARAATWARCRGALQDGAILVENGAPTERGRWGMIPGRDPHVYYACQITNDWRKIADEARVEDCTGAVVGSLELVAAWITSGRLRIVGAEDVPPEPVTRRIGHDRYRAIRRIEAGGRVAWVGHPLFADAPLVLDAQGRIVRARVMRDAAMRVYAAAGAP